MTGQLRDGTMTRAEAITKLAAWRAHADFANSAHLQRAILEDFGARLACPIRTRGIMDWGYAPSPLRRQTRARRREP